MHAQAEAQPGDGDADDEGDGDAPAEVVEGDEPTVDADAPADADADATDDDDAAVGDATEEDAPDGETPDLSEQEQNQIIGACAAFDMPDRAQGFIEARACIADVRKALWAARAQADEAITTNPIVPPAVDEETGAKPARSGIAAARAQARHAGRKQKPL